MDCRTDWENVISSRHIYTPPNNYNKIIETKDVTQWRYGYGMWRMFIINYIVPFYGNWKVNEKILLIETYSNEAAALAAAYPFISKQIL